MATPQLVAQSNRTSSEADVRALALAKVRAKKAYDASTLANANGLSDEQLVEHEIERARLFKIYWDASNAFQSAV